MILFVRIERWALLCWQILVGMNHCQLWKPLADADSHNRRTFFCQRLLWPPLLSRGPFFVQISGKYLGGFCLWFPETTPIIASDEVWCTDNVEQLHALLQPRGSVRFAAVSWEKDHFALFLCRAFFPHISEYWTRIPESYVWIFVIYILVGTSGSSVIWNILCSLGMYYENKSLFCCGR